MYIQVGSNTFMKHYKCNSTRPNQSCALYSIFLLSFATIKFFTVCLIHSTPWNNLATDSTRSQTARDLLEQNPPPVAGRLANESFSLHAAFVPSTIGASPWKAARNRGSRRRKREGGGRGVTTRKKYQPLVSIQFRAAVPRPTNVAEFTVHARRGIKQRWLHPSPPLQPRKQPRIGGGEDTETGRN